MSRKDAVVLASRTLATFFAVWALGEVSYLPGSVHSFLRYAGQDPLSVSASLYYRHYYLIALSFLVTRIIGYSLMARWLYKGGPEIEELLLPSLEEGAAGDPSPPNSMQ